MRPCIPFLLFNYEKRFRQIQEDEGQYAALLQEGRDVFQSVDTLIPEEEEQPSLVDLFTVKALRAMTHTVVNGLAEKFPRIKEGVNEVVGGNIIEFEALKILRKGEERGIQKGIQKGKMQELFGSVQDGDMKPERAARRAGLDEAGFLEAMREAGYAVPEVRAQGTV